MFLGTREQFTYFECADCGCLSRAEGPGNFDRYLAHDDTTAKRGPLSLRAKLEVAIHLSSFFSFFTDGLRRPDLEMLRRIHFGKKMSLLDVGSGPGKLVGDLRELGYRAQGIDPDIFSEVRDAFGVRVECKTLAEVSETFDVILFRHSLERLPIDTLKLARERISENGCCIACIALLGWAWRTYATDWAQLNLPRNHVLHSIKSFSLLAEKSGFRIDKVVFDSTEFQFWASDSLQRDIPLHEMAEPNRAQRARMRRVVEALNLQQQGDTAQFYLKPI